MFSKLGLIDENFLIGNVYEFLIEYPQLPYYTRFSQTSNPNIKSTNTGYNYISGYDSAYLKGLTLSEDSSYTYIDGTVNSGSRNWRYAIGTFTPWRSEYIPGPQGYNNELCNVKWVDLWIRINNYLYSNVKMSLLLQKILATTLIFLE